MTDLLLFRHATAAPADPEEVARYGPAGADARRGLTPKGRRRFKRFVEELEDEGAAVDVVVHSPWRRATETAELLVPLNRGRTEVVGGLAEPPGPALDAALVGARIAVVGHEPWLSELLSRLAGAPVGLVRWRKGGLVWLQRPGPDAPWQIASIRSPRKEG